MAYPIAWTDFTWEAFATLATGALAVGAAVLVGLRQAKISDQQRIILAQQVELDAFRLRHELFERRFAIYEDTQRYISSIFKDGDAPSDRIQNAYLGTVDKAKFLFKPSVCGDLDEIWKKSQRLFQLKRQFAHAVHGDEEAHQKAAAEEAELLNWLFSRLAKLSEIFGDEIKLGENPAT
jgi:hypothetical protein